MKIIIIIIIVFMLGQKEVGHPATRPKTVHEKAGLIK
jgi:hypothetical protein